MVRFPEVVRLALPPKCLSSRLRSISFTFLNAQITEKLDTSFLLKNQISLLVALVLFWAFFYGTLQILRVWEFIVELNSAVRPCKLEKTGANATELLVSFLSVSGTLGATKEQNCWGTFFSLLPYSSTPSFMVFVCFSLPLLFPFWGLPPDTCLLSGRGGQVRFGFCGF